MLFKSTEISRLDIFYGEAGEAGASKLVLARMIPLLEGVAG